MKYFHPPTFQPFIYISHIFVNGNVPIGMVCHCFSVVTQLGTIILCDEKIV